MKVAVDAQLAVGTSTGIGEYVTGLIAALRASGVDVVELQEPKLDPWRFDRRVFWDQIVLPQRARAAGADLLHCASGTMPIAAGLPMVATVHDVAWLRVQAHARPYARYYFGSFSVDRHLRANAIAVDSAFSRDELLELVPGLDASRVSVVYPGVHDDYAMLVRGRERNAVILAVGTVEKRKNLEIVVRALAHLPDARLVSIGPPTPYVEDCKRLAAQLGVDARVDMRGYVERDELLALYRTCSVAVAPSRYEGFGYAAAQALCAGVPLVVADTSSLPEVVGTDATIVGVDDLDAWVDALRDALAGAGDERAARARSRAIARFGWDKSALGMRAVYAHALGIEL